ncbi:MAG: SpoIIE family protein phosphatase [Bacteroidota bacterium]|nr:SpoIIE family protein phosphatase [Bacteroidota bacterium]
MEQKKEIQVKNEELGKALETVNLQKTQIEIAHTNIRESITYAQKIQQAVLPSTELLFEALPDHFVLFKPCDMVSGDFYWVRKVNQFTIVATADCTGHGIPGAFMSMLGIGLLNEIVTDTDVNEAGEVLNRLRIEIKKSLKQEGKSLEQKDGMDLALYVIDKEKMELQYSGAYNPLYLIRSGEKPEIAGKTDYRIVEQNNHTLFEIRANWQPIGIFDEEEPFATHFVKLLKDDVIYTFSDGFIDQKGGPENKKFMSKAFKELLLNIHCLPMSEQHRILDSTIEDWKGGNEQTDDILVIGVRI